MVKSHLTGCSLHGCSHVFVLSFYKSNHKSSNWYVMYAIYFNVRIEPMHAMYVQDYAKQPKAKVVVSMSQAVANKSVCYSSLVTTKPFYNPKPVNSNSKL